MIIGTTFYALVSLFIFFAIPEKSRATKHLGFSLLFAGLLAFAYIPAHLIYHPLAAYHRWLTVPAALLTHPHYAQVLYHFPDTRYKKTALFVLIFQYVLMFVITGLFIYVSSSRELTYNFASHLWDIDADDASRVVAGALILNILHLVVIGIVHIYARKGQRLLTTGLTIGLSTVLVATITNVLSRDGLMARDIHQTILVLVSIGGIFGALIIYLNNTSEKTTFMVKIVGVSMVTFMVVMVFIAFFSFQDQEDAYDALHVEQTSRLSVEHDYAVRDFEYLIVYDPGNKKAEILRGADRASGITFDEEKEELTGTAVYRRIQLLGPESWRNGVEEILRDTPPVFAPYRGMIGALAQQSRSPSDLLSRVGEKNRQIGYRAAKIRELSDSGFRARLSEYIKQIPADLSPFAQSLAKLLSDHPDLDGRELKNQALLFFSPFLGETVRRYRADARGNHFTSFMKYDPSSGVVYEAGYSYVEYRRFIHRVGLKLSLIFLSVFLVIVFGFRLFFFGTLIRPLDLLLSGVRKVNGGDFNVEVKASAADEIGFLTESFNGMVESIRTARQKLERYADELEEKVKERTAELSETLKTVQLLKTQQDGDYFLTSLLIKPLTRNLTDSQTVEIEFLIEQRKKFEFRKWKEEIGGDFCSAHSIRLNGREHTVFINADAMGKSIQGAGGALVLGAVFESIMERTAAVPSMKNQSPERWIKNTFQELQSVFESFEGSMLVSMALGLIDDETGLLYSINVEHPWSVLYRNGAASFIENQHMFRKLGITGMSGQTRILTTQLQPDDILIVGSDGRDDLILGISESGDRIINEDENLFLRIVEDAGGNLQKIRGRLLEEGELLDDLSLIRASYRSREKRIAGKAQNEILKSLREKAKVLTEEKKFTEALEALNEAFALDSRSLATIRMLVRVYLEQKEYQRAFSHVEDYIYLRPMDTDMIYLASYLCKKLKNFGDAAEFGERVRLRSPDFIKNLINLAEIYLAAGNPQRAAKLLREALKLESGNAKALRLQDRIKGGAITPG